jgi:hypothetical protein
VGLALRIATLADESFFVVTQALEGKDVKDLLVNVGSGGGAAAPAAGGAAATGGDAAPAEEEKVEGTYKLVESGRRIMGLLTTSCREGRVRRGHGFRSLRLNAPILTTVFLLLCTSTAWLRGLHESHRSYRMETARRKKRFGKGGLYCSPSCVFFAPGSV